MVSIALRITFNFPGAAIANSMLVRSSTVTDTEVFDEPRDVWRPLEESPPRLLPPRLPTRLLPPRRCCIMAKNPNPPAAAPRLLPPGCPPTAPHRPPAGPTDFDATGLETERVRIIPSAEIAETFSARRPRIPRPSLPRGLTLESR
ncbi:MAG: hypothetical protein Ct9H300mP1_13980 [Planctomycetaceae bacterium]|nr:MAG: hypothetical protein Ct9H300mP1_13980 [Planctomycetaceae bacterium]